MRSPTILLSLCIAAAAPCGPAQALIAPRDFKGTNYICSTAMSVDNVLASLPVGNVHTHAYGLFVPEVTEAEIGRIAASGLNSIRLFPSFYGWVADRVAYMECLRFLAQACQIHGVKITYVLWSGIGVTEPIASRDGVVSQELWHELIATDPAAPACYQLYQGSTARAIAHHLSAVGQGPLPPGESTFGSMHVDPGNELLAVTGDHLAWPHQIGPRIDAYLQEIATFFATDPDGRAAFGSYDLFNEPNGAAELFGVPMPNLLAFIRATWLRVQAAHPGAHCTIGWAGAGPDVDVRDAQARAAGIPCSYYSVHAYSSADVFRTDLAARKAYADGLGIDLVVSEFYRTDANAGQMRYLLDVVQDLGIGGQMWCFHQTNVFGIISGVGFAPIDGINIPSVHPTAAGIVQFSLNNPADAAAITAWTSGTLNPGPFTSVEVLDEDGDPSTFLQSGSPSSLRVRSTRIGDPVLVLISALPAVGHPCTLTGSPNCILVPGAGFVYVDPTTSVLPVAPIGPGGLSTVFAGLVLPVSWAGIAITAQAFVGPLPSSNAFSLNQGELSSLKPFPVN